MASDDWEVEVVWSTAARTLESHVLRLSEPLTPIEAILQLQASGIAVPWPDAMWTVAVWGKVRSADYQLRGGDRVELLRPLRVDPKEARRQRYRKQEATS
jgi:putative ubiquitin-RnfH superfamily antitoxin RatB of RatAB toxin-antitoxin module